MNSLLRIPYMLAGVAARGLPYIVPEGDSKLQRALFARRGITSRYREWALRSRDLSRPLVWFHAPSVGEGLQALPVIQLLRARRPEVQIAYTFYSPSAEGFSATLGTDFTDYLPFDTYSDAKAIVSALRPGALVFSKLDVWPALTESAARLGVPVGVISATLPESSGRRNTIARQLLGDAYRALDRVGAIDARDADRLREQGVRSERVSVTGDTRYDQVWARALNPPSALVQSLRSPRPTLVAGSTWPSDEEHLLPAWIEVRRSVTDARLIMAPHEINDARSRVLLAWAQASGLTVSKPGEEAANARDVVIVDRYGVLGDLYALADVAYVGGAFHAAGLHSVLEPAAFGAPVLFGPRHEKSRDASALLSSGGGRTVTDAKNLASDLRQLLGSIQTRDKAGASARATVQAGLGAAERSFQLVTSLLGR